MVNRAGRTIGNKKREKSGFRYRGRTAESIRKRAEQTGGGFDGIFKSNVDVWRPKDGDNQVRILPPTWEDADHYGYDVYVHAFVGPANGTYVCLNKMADGGCPICRMAKEAQDAGEEEEYNRLKFRKQVACYVIDRDDKDPIPKAWAMGWMLDRDISGLCHNTRTGKILLIDHPDEGYDLLLKKQGKNLQTRYTPQIDREPSSISDDQDEQDDIIDHTMENPLPSLIQIHSPEYIERVMSGAVEAKDKDLDDDDDDDIRPRGRRSRRDEDEEDQPRSRRRRGEDDGEDDEEERPRSRRSARRDDPEDDDQEEEPRGRRKDRRQREDDEEEEEAPRGRRGTRRRGEDDEEEQEEEKPRSRRSRRGGGEDEEEQEEEKPRRRRGRASDDDEDEEEEEEEKPRRRRSRVDDDEDEEEEEKPRSRRNRDADPDEEEEERPRSRRRRVEEDDAEEEEEEVKPRRRMRAR